MEAVPASKRKRQEKSKRRAQKKKAKKAALYGRAPVAPVALALAKPSGASEEDAITDAGATATGAAATATGAAATGAAAAEKQSKQKKQKKKQKRVASVSSVLASSPAGDLEAGGRRVLEWLVSPTTEAAFLDTYFEKKPLLVKRASASQPSGYFSGLLGKAHIDKALRAGKLRHNKDFSLTQYKDGARNTLLETTEAVADAADVWKLFDGPEQASVRLLRPHEHSEALWKVVAAMEAYWGCGGGCNAYLTPKGAQGFAPHFDDIDAYILQLEGTKHWTVYEHYEPPKSKSKPTHKMASHAGHRHDANGNCQAPNDDDDDDEDGGDDDDDGGDDDAESEEDDEEQAGVQGSDLGSRLFPRSPLSSSRDFTRAEVKQHLRVAMRVTLGPGDVLYIPRGMVHEARSSADTHSLHATVSVQQRNSWADFIAEALPHALLKACESDVCADLRASLPRDYAQFMGVTNSDLDDARRGEFVNKVAGLVTGHVLEHMDFDIIADRMAIKFQHDRHRVVAELPPQEAATEDAEELTLASTVALVAKGATTLTVEEDAALVYHALGNTRTHHEVDARGLEFDLEDAACIECALKSDPEVPFVVKDMQPLDADPQDKLRIVSFLVRERILQVV